MLRGTWPITPANAGRAPGVHIAPQVPSTAEVEEGIVSYSQRSGRTPGISLQGISLQGLSAAIVFASYTQGLSMCLIGWLFSPAVALSGCLAYLSSGLQTLSSGPNRHVRCSKACVTKVDKVVTEPSIRAQIKLIIPPRSVREAAMNLVLRQSPDTFPIVSIFADRVAIRYEWNAMREYCEVP